MIHILLGGFLLLVHLKTLGLVVSVDMANFWQLMHGFYWTAVGLSTQLPACSQETTYCAKKLHFRAKKNTDRNCVKVASKLINIDELSPDVPDVIRCPWVWKRKHMESQR